MPMPALYGYQEAVYRAVMRSVLQDEGRTFTVIMARQAGKNETSAQLEVGMLAQAARRGWARSGIKAAPTLDPQVRNSQLRLLTKLKEAGLRPLAAVRDGWRVTLGQSWIGFMSADPEASVVGQTANLVLEADEAQDIDPDKWQRDFVPMGATTNVTRVFWGTAWADDDLLQRAKQESLEQERRDGVQRHFEVTWDQVAAVNPRYGAYVEAEIARLGESHPLIASQYFCRTIPGQGRMFRDADLHVLQGGHLRASSRAAGEVYVAGLDVGGTAELTGSLTHDSTVLQIGRVSMVQGMDGGELPAVDLECIVAWTGTPIAELWPAIAAVLSSWGVVRVCVDATGLGEATAAYLLRVFGDYIVEPVKFTTPAKSGLGYGLMAAVRGGRCRMYAPGGGAEAAEFWKQIRAARSEFLPNRQMRFYVPEDEGHDDYLIALALLVRAAESPEAQPRIARGSRAD